MNDMRTILENANRLAELCEQIADHCRREQEGSEEVRLGIAHIIRDRTMTPDKWTELGAALHRVAYQPERK